MTRFSHLPVVVDAADAMANLESPDWPGAVAHDRSNWNTELRWVPFDIKDGRALADSASFPREAALRFSGIESHEIQDGSPPDDQGNLLIPRRGGESVVYVPWFRSEDPEHPENWVLVDAVRGEVAAGELPAAPGPAKLRLVTLLGLMLFGIYLGGAFIFAVCNLFILHVLKFHSTGLWLVTLPVMAWFAWRIKHTTEYFREPVERVENSRIRIPPLGDCGRLLQAFGYIFVVVFAVETFNVFLALLNAFTVAIPKVGFDYTDFIVMLPRAALAWFVMRFALRASRQKNGMEPVASASDWKPGTAWDLTRVCMWVAVLAVIGTWLAMLVKATGLGEWVGWDRTTSAMYMVRGAQVGAFLALHMTRMPLGTRGALSVGMVAEGVIRHLEQPWLGVPVVIGAVFVVELVSGWRRGATKNLAWNATRVAWGFCLGAVAGRLLGRITGEFLFVVLGWGGLVMADVIGAVLGGTFGYLFQRQSIGQKDGQVQDTKKVSEQGKKGSLIFSITGCVLGLAASTLLWYRFSLGCDTFLGEAAMGTGVLCGLGAAWFPGALRGRKSQTLAVAATLASFLLVKAYLFHHYVLRYMAEDYSPEVAKQVSGFSLEPVWYVVADLNKTLGTNDLLWLGLGVVLAIHLASPRKASIAKLPAR